MKTIPIIGLPVAVTNYANAVAWILERATTTPHALAVEAANTHVAALAKHDPAFGSAMKAFDLICPDGMPLIWSINQKLPQAEKLSDRVYGPTLMLETFKASQISPDFKHFLLGGKPSTLTTLQQNLSSQFPNASIAGSYSPPFGTWPDDEFSRICSKISDSGANLIWVGLGCPKQELWIANHKHLLPPGVYFGIGAAFAFHAGEVKQAPPLIQKFGLEWAFRLILEPKRLFKRYLTYNTLFVYHSLRERFFPHSRS